MGGLCSKAVWSVLQSVALDNPSFRLSSDSYLKQVTEYLQRTYLHGLPSTYAKLLTSAGRQQNQPCRVKPYKRCPGKVLVEKAKFTLHAPAHFEPDHQLLSAFFASQSGIFNNVVSLMNLLLCIMYLFLCYHYLLHACAGRSSPGQSD